MIKRKRKKGQTLIYKKSHRKQKIDQHDLQKKENGGELMCSGRISSSWSAYGTHRANLVIMSMISHQWEKDRIVITTNGTHPWSFVTQILRNGQPSHGGDRKTVEWRIQLSHMELLVRKQLGHMELLVRKQLSHMELLVRKLYPFGIFKLFLPQYSKQINLH